MKDLLSTPFDRRSFLTQAGIAGLSLTAIGALVGCGGSGSSNTPAISTSMDTTILGAAKIAEALATTMYSAIITDAPFFATLTADNKSYITAARDEEKYHYDLLKAATGSPDAQLKYYFPTNMFTDPTTTMNTLITLEDAFIAAYLIGVKDLSTPGLRVLAAQIMGVESDHRTLARVISNDLGMTSTTGLSGTAEPIRPINNNVYERTYNLTSISQVVTALTPFLSMSTSYSVAKTFNPAYTPVNTGLYPNPANG